MQSSRWESPVPRAPSQLSSPHPLANTRLFHLHQYSWLLFDFLQMGYNSSLSSFFGLFYLLFQSKPFLPLLPSSILYRIPCSFRHNILLDPAWHISTCPVVSIPPTNSYFSSKSKPRGMWYPVVRHPSYIKCPSDITGTNSRSLNLPSCPGGLDLGTSLHFGYVFLGSIPSKWIICLHVHPGSLPGWLLQLCTAARAKKHIFNF